MICLDAFVEADDTHMELCRALRTTRSDASQFKLCVRRLDLSSMQIARIVVLLEQVDPEVRLVLYSLILIFKFLVIMCYARMYARF